MYRFVNRNEANSSYFPARCATLFSGSGTEILAPKHSKPTTEARQYKLQFRTQNDSLFIEMTSSNLFIFASSTKTVSLQNILKAQFRSAL